MPSPKENAFLELWPKRFMKFLSIIEIVCFLFLIATELGNVASNFWITNVFAGDWCGLVMLIHSIMLFIIGCCLPGPKAAFRVVILTIVALVACALLISFDSIFIAQPSTCVLTSSCSTNAASTTIFSYSLQQAFFTTFNTLGPFRTYTTTQAKFFFQAIQIGVGCLCFALCLVYLGIYFFIIRKVDERLRSSKQKGKQNSHAPRPVPREKQKTDYKALQSTYQQQEKDSNAPRSSLQQKKKHFNTPWSPYQHKKASNGSEPSNQLQEKDVNASQPSYQHKEQDSNPHPPSYQQQEKDSNAPRPSSQQKKKYFDAPWSLYQQKKASNGSGPSNQQEKNGSSAARRSYEDFTSTVPGSSTPRISQVVPIQVSEIPNAN